MRECVFAPYFCHEQGASHFATIYKVFGASNVSKLLAHLPVTVVVKPPSRSLMKLRPGFRIQFMAAFTGGSDAGEEINLEKLLVKRELTYGVAFTGVIGSHRRLELRKDGKEGRHGSL